MKVLVWKSLVLAALSVGILVLFNAWFDPFSVIRRNYARMMVCPNERIIKADHLIQNPDKYDALIFGSSVVNMISVNDLNRLTGNRWYNMTYIGGLPADHVRVMKDILGHGVKLKHILVGIDYLAFRLPELVGAGYLRRLHAPRTIREKIEHYYDFLTPGFDTSILFEVRFDGKQTLYDVTGTGQYYMFLKDQLMKRYPDRHNAKFIGNPMGSCSFRPQEVYGELRQLIDLCKRHDIRITFFINPMNDNWYRCEDIVLMNLARAVLAGMSSYWDFSGGSSITKDNFNFYDITHYRPEIGHMMVSRIFGDGTGAPADFGRLVTVDTLAAHLAWAEKNYAALGGAFCEKCPSHQGVSDALFRSLMTAPLLLPTDTYGVPPAASPSAR